MRGCWLIGCQETTARKGYGCNQPQHAGECHGTAKRKKSWERVATVKELGLSGRGPWLGYKLLHY